jgi:hypothetical protein
VSVQVFGTIKAIAGSNIRLATRTGKFVRIDAADAVRSNHRVVLLVGEPTMVSGGYDGSGGIACGDSVACQPSPRGGPADR